jgi:cleavage and polyadenylation specificity factor subunit 3
MTSSSSSTKRVAANEDVMEITPLGAGQEVGRSCVLMTFKGKQVLFDAGVHPAYNGLACLPYFDMIDDPSKIDVLLVTHFHLDHCASVPYFTEKVRRTHTHTRFFSAVAEFFKNIDHFQRSNFHDSSH